MPADLVSELCFALGYVQHGGSGLGWSRRDVLEADFDEALKMVETLHETRQKEAAALRSAYRKR